MKLAIFFGPASVMLSSEKLIFPHLCLKLLYDAALPIKDSRAGL